jgi:hypothetical protein
VPLVRKRKESSLRSRPIDGGIRDGLAMAVTLVLALSGIAGKARPARAAQPPKPGAPHRQEDAQNAYEPRTGPGAGQALLARFAGSWEVVKTFYPFTGEPVRTPGECRQQMVHDGHYLQSDFVFFDRSGGKTTGTGISGFDPRSGKFTTVWYDSRGTTMSLRQSDGAFDGKEIVLYAASLDGTGPARRSITRSHLEEDGRVLVHRHYLVQDDGKERLMMELRMTRKAAGAGSGADGAD